MDITEREGQLYVSGADFLCLLNLESGRLSIGNVDRLKQDDTSMKYHDIESLKAVVNEALKGTKHQFSNFTFCRLPESEWTDKHFEISLIDEPVIHGYPTLGFAGHLSATVDLRSGRIIEFSFWPPRPVDKPNIQVTEQEALDKAAEVWAMSAYAKVDSKRHAGLQFYFLNEKDATKAGLKVIEKGHVRMCWTVRYWSEKITRNGRVTTKGLTSVVIDAETGDILRKLPPAEGE